MTISATNVEKIPKIGHDEAMRLAETEYRRLLDVVEQLGEADWRRPTDCQLWDVKALLSHMLGGMEGNASIRESIRQFRLAAKASKSSGRPFIDEMTDRQVREHASLPPAEMASRLRDTAPKALRGRRGMPALMRAMRFNPGPPAKAKWTFGFLVDIILNRDNWMHRIDLTRSTENELTITGEHDGRIVADVVAEWARAHGQPFSLILEGAAGGAFVHGQGGEEHRLDAIEFCRILSGRAKGSGLLSQEVPF